MRNKIGFVGKMGAGKTTAAQYLYEEHGFIKLAFANKLKEICSELFDIPIGENKSTIIPVSPEPLTVREIYQLMGTEVARRIDADVWTNYLERTIDKYINDSSLHGLVVDDIRFINEAEMLKSKGFYIVYIHGNHYALENQHNTGHQSEMEVSQIPVDAWVDNTGSIEALKVLVEGIVSTPAANVAL